jgi:hypothetical protein
MLKLSILIGVPSATVYLATAVPRLLESDLFIVVLSAAALLVGILVMQVGEKSRP